MVLWTLTKHPGGQIGETQQSVVTASVGARCTPINLSEVTGRHRDSVQGNCLIFKACALHGRRGHVRGRHFVTKMDLA